MFAIKLTLEASNLLKHSLVIEPYRPIVTSCQNCSTSKYNVVDAFRMSSLQKLQLAVG